MPRRFSGPCWWTKVDDPTQRQQGQVDEALVADDMGRIALTVTWPGRPGKQRWRLTLLRASAREWTTGGGRQEVILALPHVDVRDDGCDAKGPWKDETGEWTFKADLTRIED